MKTQKIFLGLALLITSLSFGQITTESGTGKVGIGTTTPEAKLDVAGDLQVNGGADSFYGFGPASSAKPIDARPNSQFPYVFNWHTGLTFSAHSAYGGIRFYNQGYPDIYGSGVLVMSINNNSVGIGTTTPYTKLDVEGSITLGSQSVNANTTKLFLKNPSGKTWALSSGANMINENHFSIYNWTDSAAAPFFSVLDNGNIGIGDSVPLSKLSLKEGGQLLNFITNKKLAGTWPPTSEATTMTIQSSGNSAGNLAFATGNSEAMRIIPNGNVGIGTTTPDQKITVNGIIHAKEIIVDTAITPDYVFQKYYTGKSTLKSDYVMPTLAEIENFTKKNHHLPNVPSAQEVQQNGVSLGTMSNVLLQKVEELTLYAIEQQKKLDEQNKIIATLAARLVSLEKK